MINFIWESKHKITCSAIRIILLLVFIMPGSSSGATIFQEVGIASPPSPVGSGARAMGMAGAFISVADDATAASWNPAGLIQLEKPEISVVGAYRNRNTSYTSDTHPESDTSSRDDDASVNYLSAALPFHLYKNMVVSINYQRLYDFKRSLGFDHDLSSQGVDLNQRIQYQQDGHLGAVAIAGAIELTPQLSVGAAVNFWTDALGGDNGWKAHYQSHATGTQAGVPVTIDTRIDETYDQFRGINCNMGLLWETRQYGTFGAVIKTPFTATIDHTYEFSQTTTYGDPVNTTLDGDPSSTEEEVELRMPWSYGAGWSKRIRDVWTFGVDLYRTEWGDYTLTDSQGNDFSPIDGRLRRQSHVDATTHVRIGTEYVFLLPEKKMALPLRAGLFYDPEPAHGAPRDYYGIAMGAGLTRSSYSLDLACQLRWAGDDDGGDRIDTVGTHLLLSFIYYF